ncbi:MAG: tRNA (adenosine(37)-N6)-dimethylallyltransferase MiaA [Bacteroidota bacterium]|nr:tRNA (adenosine(37)-N6)-dimethylallyltransferase MiaA [Bacteroidota bacterium]MDP3146638.1 tRNA (adenosine(37)-N6)-dimethylallyltransferase MiaA [Bacteroidota bacterium]
MKNNCIVILGPTASGKTHLACAIAANLNGEIISADSRQVYKDLNIGTGKDLDEYVSKGKKINYHLIDIISPEEQFYLHDFIRELKVAFDKITHEKKIPIICGGTGLYLDALHKDFSFTQIKENTSLRNTLDNFSKEELQEKLKLFNSELLKKVDLNSKKRLIRAIEIAEHLENSSAKLPSSELHYHPYYIGIKIELEKRRERIYERLINRINNGLIEEVEGLLETGITHERLQFFGLEYKFISLYLIKKITKEELILQLGTAINQFAKRQMTWFRKMEKEGVKINWVESDVNLDQLLKEIKSQF